eukprot:scaffold2393_cov267-Pinguiococcus_pyrenoidosus.AAC.12
MGLRSKVENFTEVLAAAAEGDEPEEMDGDSAVAEVSDVEKRLQKLRDELDLLEAGEHSRFLRKRKELEHTKRRRILAAQNFRNHQYRNFEQLYDFDVVNATALYETAVEQLKDAEVARIDREIARLSKVKEDFDTAVKQGNVSAMTLRRKEAPEQAAKDKRKGDGGKETAKSGPNGTAAATQREGMPGQAKRDGGSVFLRPHLNQVDIRDDLHEIVSDLKQRSKNFTKRTSSGEEDGEVPPMHSLQVPEEGSILKLDEVIYCPGDVIQATSVLSGEDFDGVIREISALEECMYMALLSGPLCRIRFRHLRVGRIVLRRKGQGDEKRQAPAASKHSLRT